MKLSLKQEHIDLMIEHSKKEVPAEACGVLAGLGNNVAKVFTMTNDEHSNSRYLVNPKEQFAVFKQIREEGLELLGVYHSHVASEAYPSQTDCRLAAYDIAYFIISLQNKEPAVKAYRIKDDNISEEEYEVL